MADLLNAGAAPLTMSSREIASLTGSSHDNVLKTVRRLVAEGVVSANETPYSHPQNGQTYMEFQLSFRDTMVVVSGYSAELRARIIDRWQELEQRGAPPAFPDLSNPATLRGLLLSYTEKVLALEATIEHQAPRVAFAEAVGAAETDQALGDAAKALGTGQRRLFAFLRERGVLLPNNLPAQRHVDLGRFRVVERPYKDAAGAQRVRLQTRVTGKGLTYVQQLLARASETQGA